MDKPPTRLPKGHFTGCCCGHGTDEDSDCIRHQPIPKLKGCGGCLALDRGQIEAAARAGYFCGEGRCAMRSLLGGAA